MRAFYTIIQGDQDEKEEWWKDKDFITSLDQISSDLKSGVDKGNHGKKLKTGC